MLYPSCSFWPGFQNPLISLFNYILYTVGFDAPQVFYSDNFGSQDGDAGQGDLGNNLAVKKRCKEFLRQFHDGGHTAFSYKYRDALKRNYALHQFWISVNLEDVASFDEALADKLYKVPTDFIPIFEEAATEVADEVTSPRPAGEEELQDIQVILQSEGDPISVRGLGSDRVSRLVKIPGIIVSASGIKAKATQISIQCRSCRTVVPNIPIKPGLEGYALPRK